MLVAVFLLVVSYLLGGLNGAYCVAKAKAGLDIRETGSGNAGARNAGRVFGRSAFVYTVLIDAGKTVFPLLLAASFYPASDFLLGSMALALLVGHNWPVQLQGRGGKGVVVYLAAALALAPLTLLPVGLVLGIGLLSKLSFTIAGLFALASLPVTLWIVAQPVFAIFFLVMFLLLLLAHKRRNGSEPT